jgi:excisionase family DNA binding protein
MNPAIVEEDWLTTEQVADRCDTSTRAVLHMIHFGRLSARKIGRVWWVHVSDVPDIWPPPVEGVSEV